MNNRINVVAVGTGYFSQFHYEAWSRVKDAQVVGICSLDKQTSNQVKHQYDIDYIGSDLEHAIKTLSPTIIDIITPPSTHRELIEIAAKYRVNVIVQKPFGLNISEAKYLVNLAKEAGIDLIVHENFRFKPWYRKMREILKEEMLGDVLNVNFNLRPGDGQGDQAYLSRQPYFQTMTRFLIHETAIHFIDTFRFLFGEVSSVYAHLRKCNEHIKGEDSALVIFDINDGIQATFNGNRLLDHKAKNPRTTMGEMLIEGTKGVLRMDGDAHIYFRAFQSKEEVEINYQWRDHSFGGDCVFNLISHIVAHYTQGTLLENQASEYLTNLKIEEAIYLSNEKRIRVDIND
ncbi:Gfo/Idh/MocA family oxidoreductase [Vibrio sp. CK2-1]|uniref:Gfo/Idh/MocA family protein n=1 Tax=Vibrio sp. CK2-1 TaxID=2912249 RepID=UPI001F39B5D1|nr:Gfo/Idh/MocA family oxidoreductase [Vibrio sp. CK2-1]MCF7353171.1 Gfo/Idh/MocA family oxidoreductase [Vibrio sp. CK2-1]